MAGKFEEIGSQEASQPISLLIWGDSHARSLTPALDELCRKFSQRGVQATHSLTAPVLEYNSTSSWSLKEDSPAFANAVLAFVTQRRVQNVIIAAEWCSYPASDSLKAKLLATVRAFLDSGARVYVVKDVPISTFDVPRLVSSTARYGGDVQKLGVTRERHEMLNREFQQTFATISQMGATVLDPADYFLNRDGFYEVVRNEQVLYFDSDHLTLEGSSLLKPLFEPIFHAEWQRGL